MVMMWQVSFVNVIDQSCQQWKTFPILVGR